MTREEAAEKLISLWYFLVNNDYPQKDLDALKVAIKTLSCSEKPNKWIPVSERLPEKATRVLTSWVYVPTGAKYIEVAERWGDDDDYTFYGDTDEYKMNRKDHKVIAWMPLVEPYKVESEEKE